MPQILALQKSRDSLATALSQTNTTLSQTNSNVSSIIKSIDSIRTQLTSIGVQITTLNNQISTANANISSINEQITTLSKQYNDLLSRFNALLSQLNTLNTSNGLVAYFPFSGNVDDASSSKLIAINSNASLTSDRNGVSNSAYYFNGTSSKIVVNNFDKILGNNPFTVSLWVAPETSTGWFVCFGKSQNGNAFECGTHTYGSSNFDALIWKYDYFTPVQTKLSMNIFQNIIITYDGSIMKVYLNGDLSSRLNVNYVTTNILSGILTIGKQIDFEEYFKGKLDEIRIYNRVINDSEVTYLANN